MPTKHSTPKPAAPPTPAKAKASRWITAAQHAELMALMADDVGSSPPFIRGPRNLLMLYLDDTKNTAKYHYISNTEPPEGYYWTTNSLLDDDFDFDFPSTTVSVQTKGLQSVSEHDAELSFCAPDGTVLATKKITILRPAYADRVTQTSPACRSYVSGVWTVDGWMTYSFLDQFRHPFPPIPKNLNSVFVNELLSEESKTSGLYGCVYGSGGANTRSDGTILDHWLYLAYDPISTNIAGLQKLTIGDWISDGWYNIMGTNSVGNALPFDFGGVTEVRFTWNIPSP